MVRARKSIRTATEKSKTIKTQHKSTVHHAVHLDQNKRLNRVVGQIQAIQRMIIEETYCNDILIQLRAASAALRAVELTILKTHMRHCVSNAVNSGDVKIAESKVEELIGLLDRY